MANELGAQEGSTLLWNPGPLGPFSVLVLGRLAPLQPPTSGDLWERVRDWNSAHAGDDLLHAFSDAGWIRTGQQLLEEVRQDLDQRVTVVSVDTRWDRR